MKSRKYKKIIFIFVSSWLNFLGDSKGQYPLIIGGKKSDKGNV